MFSTKDIIGDVVFISFQDVSQFSDIGLSTPSSHFLVKGQDHLGLWVEHPGLCIITSEDEDGKPLPAEKQLREEIEAIFFVHWHQIKTIMHYPKREGYDLTQELFTKKIGFMQGEE
jgi:hypothetical protein